MKAALPLALAALLLSGCFGPAPGAIAPGEPVQVRVIGKALDGTVVYPEETFTVTNATGEQGELLLRLRQELAGRLHGQSFTFVVAGSEFPGRVHIGRIQGSTAIEEQVPVDQYPGAKVGDRVQYLGLNHTVLSATNTTVRLRAEVADGHRAEFPELGLALVFRIQGGRILRTVEVTTPDHVFRAPEQAPGFQRGAYRVAGVEGDRILLDYNPFPDQSVRYTVRIVSQATPVGEDGNYIARSSTTRPVAGNLTAGDGHTDHTH